MQFFVPECGGGQQKSSGHAAALSQDGDCSTYFHIFIPFGEDNASSNM